MNPVLLLTRNNLDLTKRCVESVRNQDVPTEIYIYDNASSDGTSDWAISEGIAVYRSHENSGVSKGWNWGLDFVFRELGFDHCLVAGNDTLLARWTYSALLSANVPFVTGVDVGMSDLPEKPDVFPLTPNPDFSLFLMRDECWNTVGMFDEQMVMYVQDCSYHVRAHRLGMPLWKSSTPYNHTRSSTMNRAEPKERHAIQTQANKDRAVFQSIYGCLPGTAAYNDLFKEPCGQAQTK